MQEALNADLGRYTTLKIGGVAKRLFQPHTVDELVSVVSRLNDEGEPWFILGGGSNLLVSSDGVEGSVIRTATLTGIRTGADGLLDADAGARLPHLAKYAASLGLSGLEFAVGIPGTVGGAVIMNAGAHGSCIANILHDATVFDTLEGDLITIAGDQLEFEYRRCKLDPARHVVVSARFSLDKGDPEEIEDITHRNEDYRWKTQPIGWPNAGSTFKNPEPKRSAGFLLDSTGAKNLKVGQAAVSAIHANFVINLGGATSFEVTSLMGKMKRSVCEAFQISLKPEWKTMGKFTSEEEKVWETMECQKSST